MCCNHGSEAQVNMYFLNGRLVTCQIPSCPVYSTAMLRWGTHISRLHHVYVEREAARSHVKLTCCGHIDELLTDPVKATAGLGDLST